MRDYCCDGFKEYVERGDNGVGAFEFLKEDNTWAINGCCGGGCFVLTDMKFCPFCGKKVIETKKGEE